MLQYKTFARDWALPQIMTARGVAHEPASVLFQQLYDLRR